MAETSLSCTMHGPTMAKSWSYTTRFGPCTLQTLPCMAQFFPCTGSCCPDMGRPCLRAGNSLPGLGPAFLWTTGYSVSITAFEVWCTKACPCGATIDSTCTRFATWTRSSFPCATQIAPSISGSSGSELFSSAGLFFRAAYDIRDVVCTLPPGLRTLPFDLRAFPPNLRAVALQPASTDDKLSMGGFSMSTNDGGVSIKNARLRGRETEFPSSKTAAHAGTPGYRVVSDRPSR